LYRSGSWRVTWSGKLLLLLLSLLLLSTLLMLALIR
jgi:hypothetical protein